MKIAKGAKVKNCVLMQDTIVGEGTKLEYIISDKNVKITDGKRIKGVMKRFLYLLREDRLSSERCMLCPRQCQIKREEGKSGFVGSRIWSGFPEPASYVEEPCISGINGSGAVFFLWLYASMCILPEYHIANSEVGKTVRC